MRVSVTKSHSKKNGLIIEEWLTEHRARLFKKCKELKAKKLIKDCITQDGDVYAFVIQKPGIGSTTFRNCCLCLLYTFETSAGD
jgi:hypothetical protein